jgi:hypothetical protein
MKEGSGRDMGESWGQLVPLEKGESAIYRQLSHQPQKRVEILICIMDTYLLHGRRE